MTLWTFTSHCREGNQCSFSLPALVLDPSLYTHTHMHTGSYSYTYTLTYAHVHIHTYTCSHSHTDIHTYAHMPLYTCTHKHTHICTCMHTLSVPESLLTPHLQPQFIPWARHSALCPVMTFPALIYILISHPHPCGALAFP